MEKLSPVVQEAFGINSRRIRKEKGRYICDTPGGPMSIYISAEPAEVIRLQHLIKEQLAEKGFPWTDRYQPAGTGLPYIQIGRETYVMVKHHYERSETDFDNEADVLRAFKYLAHFHAVARGMPVELPHTPPVSEIYARQMSELAQAGKHARRGPRMSDFDVSFIKHAPIYSEIMQDSINRLAGTNYAALYSQAISQGTICHNSLKEENLPSAGGVTYLANFSDAAVDLQLADLAALVRRYAQRSSKAIPANRLLEAYNTVNPLPDGAGEILRALLIFPWAFMKIVTQYYSKKRNWTPGGLINRMDAILAERESYEKFVEIM